MKRKALFVILLVVAILLSSCGGGAPATEAPASTEAPATEAPPVENVLNIVRLSPPALLQFSEDLSLVNEIPLSLPAECRLNDIYSPPFGSTLAVELSCSFGPSLLFLNVDTGSVTTAFPNADSHFLAWAGDSQSAYLRVDSFNFPRIVRVNADSLNATDIPISEFTYDLAANPVNSTFVFAVSNGYGLGSELYLADENGGDQRLLYQDRSSYIAFSRWSPDGGRIAFVKIPDSQIPFTVGELWTINADGTNPRRLSAADAGHGYAANWSPDGSRIAFVYRLNPDDSEADYNSSALTSDIKVINSIDGTIVFEARLQDSLNATPYWSPDGNRLFFQREGDGRIEILTADLATGGTTSISSASVCCISWMRK